MAYNLKSEEEVKQYLNNLGIEYRFGCYSEKNPEVCHLLGDYLEAIKRDFKKAAKVYKNNCDEFNYGKSCSKYGSYLVFGRGVDKPDKKAAYEYFEKGCKLECLESCFKQGLLLVMDSSSCGVKEDTKKAMSLLERSCLEGKNPEACYYLSGMYLQGVKKKLPENEKSKGDVYEVCKDMQKAFKFASEGCHLGNIYSCANVSQMYARGEGVEKNSELAEKYKNIALEMQKEITSNKTLTFQQGLSN